MRTIEMIELMLACLVIGTGFAMGFLLLTDLGQLNMPTSDLEFVAGSP